MRQEAVNRASFSIVCICYNNLEGLKKTLSSIMMQSRAPEEILIIDGASTDGTQEWVAAQSFPASIHFMSEPDNGIYDALNKGVARSREQLVLFTNSGDELSAPDVLAFLEKDFSARGWSWAFGDALLVSPDGSITGRHRLRYFRKLSFYLGAQSVPSQAIAVEREFLNRVGQFRTDIGNSADQEHVARMWALAKPRYLRRTLARFDTSGVSAADQPGDFSIHRRRHRQLQGRLVFSSNSLDRLVTGCVLGYKRSRSRLKHFVTSAMSRK